MPFHPSPWYANLEPWLPVLLLLGPLLLRTMPGRRQQTAGWCWRQELPLMAAVALTMGLICGLWLYRYHIPEGALISSDFGEHCDAIAAIRLGPIDSFSHNRSRLAAWLPALLTHFDGILDAFLLAGLVCMVVTIAGVYLWARALHGRLAGVTAAVAVGAMAPMVLLSHHASFYPEIMAVSTLAAGLAALALRYPSCISMLLAGIGAGLCFLVDLRGLMFGLPFLGLAALGTLGRPWARTPLRLACLALPVVLAWFGGRLAYNENTLPLENQVNLRQRFLDRGYDNPLFRERPKFDSAYVWGLSSPWQIPQTLLHLWQERQVKPDEERLEREVVLPRQQHVEPLIPITIGAFALAALGLRRKPWLLLGLLATSLPFFVSMQAGVTFQRSLPRYLGTSMVFIPLWLGLAYASLAHGALARHPAPTDDAGTPMPAWGRALWWLTATVLPLLVVLGVIPSLLSPAARWREFQQATGGAEEIMDYHRASQGHSAPGLRVGCTRLIADEVNAGGPHLVTLVQPHPRGP